MSKASDFLGGGGVPIGGVAEVINSSFFETDPDYLPLGVDVDPTEYPDILSMCYQGVYTDYTLDGDTDTSPTGSYISYLSYPKPQGGCYVVSPDKVLAVAQDKTEIWAGAYITNFQAFVEHTGVDGYYFIDGDKNGGLVIAVGTSRYSTTTYIYYAKSTNGGASFSNVGTMNHPTQSVPTIGGVVVDSNGVAIMASNDGYIYRSYDGSGSTWAWEQAGASGLIFTGIAQDREAGRVVLVGRTATYEYSLLVSDDYDQASPTWTTYDISSVIDSTPTTSNLVWVEGDIVTMQGRFTANSEQGYMQYNLSSQEVVTTSVVTSPNEDSYSYQYNQYDKKTGVMYNVASEVGDITSGKQNLWIYVSKDLGASWSLLYHEERSNTSSSTYDNVCLYVDKDGDGTQILINQKYSSTTFLNMNRPTVLKENYLLSDAESTSGLTLAVKAR